jgi:hypothetical protein
MSVAEVCVSVYAMLQCCKLLYMCQLFVKVMIMIKEWYCLVFASLLVIEAILCSVAVCLQGNSE